MLNICIPLLILCMCFSFPSIFPVITGFLEGDYQRNAARRGGGGRGFVPRSTVHLSCLTPPVYTQSSSGESTFLCNG